LAFLFSVKGFEQHGLAVFIRNILYHDSGSFIYSVENTLNVKVEIDLFITRLRILFLLKIIGITFLILVFLSILPFDTSDRCSTSSWTWIWLGNEIVVFMDWDIARVMLWARIIKITLILTQVRSWIMLLHNLRWALSFILFLLNHIAYLHLYLFIALGIWCTNWLINKHSGVWVKSLEIYNFLDFNFVWAYLVRFNETLFLTYWKRHFLKGIIVVLLLKLIRIRICWSGLTHFVKLLISWTEIIGAIFISLAHLFWTFNFKHI